MISTPVVVIGHVDHGKTALVRALTGIDTDRLDEEKRRGLSITPGFAFRTYPAGTIDFIDAPGHADFIRAMVSGASGAQAALLVISARAGIASQTVEHLRIAGILGIRRGVIALSKCDGLSENSRRERTREVREFLANTTFAQAPLVSCSASSSEGLEELHSQMENLLVRQAGPQAAPMGPYLPIDRVFTVQGRGVVVTGTLLGQRLKQGDKLMMQPRGRLVTLRGLQSRGAACQGVVPGARTAANLRGITAKDISAGDVLSGADGLFPATQMDVAITLLPDARSLRHMQQIRVLIGTTTAVAKVRLLDAPNHRLLPGACTLARLHIAVPLIAYAGQRVVLRHLSPAQTIGGAVVLDPQAPRNRNRPDILAAALEGDALRIAGELVESGQGTATLTEIARLARMTSEVLWQLLAPGYVGIGCGQILARTAEAAYRAQLLTELQDFHSAHPTKTIAPRSHIVMPQAVIQHLETTLMAEGLIVREEGGIALAGHNPMQQLDRENQDRMARIENAILLGGTAPPDRSEIVKTGEEDLLKLLIHSGKLMQLENVALNQMIVFHTQSLIEAEGELRARFPVPQWFRTGEARAALGTSRKFIVPLLEFFDRSGITLRADALRQMAPEPAKPAGLTPGSRGSRWV